MTRHGAASQVAGAGGVPVAVSGEIRAELEVGIGSVARDLLETRPCRHACSLARVLHRRKLRLRYPTISPAPHGQVASRAQEGPPAAGPSPAPDGTAPDDAELVGGEYDEGPTVITPLADGIAAG